jgi:hypothetical protein
MIETQNIWEVQTKQIIKRTRIRNVKIGKLIQLSQL